MKSPRTSAPAATLALLLTGCGASQSSVQISGGQNADAQAPVVVNRSVVALATNAEFFNARTNPASPFCSGTIIAPHLVLTAAHCSETLDRQMTLVIFSASAVQARRDTANRIRQISGFERHPGYPMVRNDVGVLVSPYSKSPEKWLRENPGTPPHDLAIVRFSGELPAGYEPAILTEPEALLPEFATLAGFGITGSSKVSDNGILRYVAGVKMQPMDEDSQARQWLPVAETMDVSRISAGEHPRGACPGDSGGPAFGAQEKTSVLMGVLSLGESERAAPDSTLAYCLGHKKGASPTTGNIYTDLRSYRAWIEAVRQRLDP